MHDRDDGVGARLLQGQQQGKRTTKSGTPAQNDDLAAADVDAVVDEHRLDSGGRARDRSTLLEHELAQVDGVQTIGILPGVHARQGLVEVETRGHRMLDDVRVDFRVRVETVDGGKEFGLAGLRRNLGVERGNPYLLARLVLLADVARGRRVVSDEDRAETGSHAGRLKFFDPLRDFAEDRLGDRLACKELSCHSSVSMAAAPDRSERPLPPHSCRGSSYIGSS